jgi:hypothetical protein
MRFIIATLASLMVSQTNGKSCQSYCHDLAECKQDPHHHGSYCKSWQKPDVCFGLYWTDETETSMCFYPNNKDCPEKRPVRCPKPEPTDPCREICKATPGCKNDPHHHGSYCKKWQTKPVCFGLYWTDATKTKTCFHSTERETCKSKYPVKCGA